MKKMSVVMLSLFILSASIPGKAHSFGWFLFGMAVGSSGNSPSDGRVSVSGNPNTLYTIARASDRVKDPLKIRIRSTSTLYFALDKNDKRGHRFDQNFYAGGMSLNELFYKANPGKGEFEILQIIRIFSPENPNNAVMWFAYTEKSNLFSLKELRQMGF